jgi:hypothetical protein
MRLKSCNSLNARTISLPFTLNLLSDSPGHSVMRLWKLRDDGVLSMRQSSGRFALHIGGISVVSLSSSRDASCVSPYRDRRKGMIFAKMTWQTQTLLYNNNFTCAFL